MCRAAFGADPSRVWTLEQAARLWGVPVGRLLAEIKAGRLAGYAIDGRVMVRGDELDALLVRVLDLR